VEGKEGREGMERTSGEGTAAVVDRDSNADAVRKLQQMREREDRAAEQS